MALRVVVDYDRCRSNGQCVAVAPEVFAIDDEGYLQHDESQDDARLRLVLHAAQICPQQAITVHRDA